MFYEYSLVMKSRAIKNLMLEHLSILADASVHQMSDPEDIFAHQYHYHNTLEVITIKRGWVEGLVGGIMGKMTEGMTVVLGGDVPHCVLRASDDSKAILVHIPSDLLMWNVERFPELAQGMDYIEKCKDGIVYDDICLANEITRLSGRIDSADGFLRMSLIMRLLHTLSTTHPASTLLIRRHNVTVRKENESPIDRTFRYLYEHYRESFSLSELAAYAGINSTALCRSFKRSCGCTIWQFCSRLRIEYACNLLHTTDMDIGQIAYMSGYNSYSHFCTQFKKLKGISPTVYRGKLIL